MKTKHVSKRLMLLAGLALSLPLWAWGACASGPTRMEPATRQSAYFEDPQTRLTWQRCSVGTTWKAGVCKGTVRLLSWPEAKAVAKASGDNWRLPTVRELHGLLQTGCDKRAVDAVAFPDIQDLGEGGAPYWSSTPIAAMPPLVYYVDLMDGSVDGHSPGFALAVRLVRERQ